MIEDRISEKTAEENPIESFVRETAKQPGKEILPEAMKYTKKGIPYAEEGRLSSLDVVAFIISESIREWNRIKNVYGKYNTEYLNDGSRIKYSTEADTTGKALDQTSLSDYLEKYVAKQSYRPCLIAWSHFATDESIERMTADYEKMNRDDYKEKNKAGNIREALKQNDSPAALHFFERIGELDAYASLHPNAVAVRDIENLPDFGFDSDGVKRYDIGDNVIEVSITPELGFRLYDSKTLANSKKKVFLPVYA